MQSKKRLSRAAAYGLRTMVAAILLVSEGAANSEPATPDEALVNNFSTAPRLETAQPEVIVFNNALLDRIFGKQRQREQVEPIENEAVKEAVVNPAPAAEPKVALLSPDEVFTVRLNPKMPAQQRALLRFAERGRYFLQAGDPARALSFFEKALGIGATQYLPYIYYYLAQSHFRLGNYHAAREFRVVAEAWLGEFPDWQVELARLEQQSLVG